MTTAPARFISDLETDQSWRRVFMADFRDPCSHRPFYWLLMTLFMSIQQQQML